MGLREFKNNFFSEVVLQSAKCMFQIFCFRLFPFCFSIEDQKGARVFRREETETKQRPYRGPLVRITACPPKPAGLWRREKELRLRTVLSVRLKQVSPFCQHPPELINGAPRPLFLQWKIQEYSRRFAREYPLELRRELGLTERCYTKNGRLIPTAKRGKEIKQP